MQHIPCVWHRVDGRPIEHARRGGEANMEHARVEQWLTPTERGVVARLVVDGTRGVPRDCTAARRLDHPALPFALVAAFATGEGPMHYSSARALIVRLDAASTGLVEGIEPTVALARLAEFIDVALSVAEAASLAIARVEVVPGGLSFALVDEALPGDAVLLWRAAILQLADARGFTVERLQIDIDGVRVVVDGESVRARL
jgi:hypothetical protein